MLMRYTLLLACVFFNVNLYTSPVNDCKNQYRDYFSYFARQEGNKILINKQINLGDLSILLRQNYDDCISRALDRLCSDFSARVNPSGSMLKIQNVVADELKGFVEYIETLVFVVKIDSEVNDAVCDLLHKNGLVKDDIFKNSSDEYNSRYEKVKNKLQSVMLVGHRNYVTKMEIEEMVRCEFTTLVARIKKAKADEVEKSKQNISTFWTWLIGAGSNSTKSELYSIAGDKVYKNELEQRIVSIVNSVLQEKGFQQDSLPARVIPDYCDAVQKIIKYAKDKIFYNNYEYLYVDEIKAISRVELRPVLDKI